MVSITPQHLQTRCYAKSTHVPQHVSELSWSGQVESFLEACDDRLDAAEAMFSLLADPEIDDHIKFKHSGFPHGDSTRALLDDSWYMVYSVDNIGNVMVYQIRRRADIDHMGRLLGGA